jgi:hypothetical protein
MTGPVSTRQTIYKVAEQAKGNFCSVDSEAMRADSYVDVRTLQRTAGNQATSRLLPVSKNNPADKAVALPPIVRDVLHSPGQPLERDTQAFLESRFGMNLDRVRLHTDVASGRSARAIDAAAYSVGNDIVMDIGSVSTTSGESPLLLAHELAHVVQQQKRQNLLSTTQGGESPLAELEADRAAEALYTSQPVTLSPRATSGELQRKRRGGQEKRIRFLGVDHETKLLRNGLKYAGKRSAKKWVVNRFYTFSLQQVYWIVQRWKFLFPGEDLFNSVAKHLGNEALYVQRRIDEAEKHVGARRKKQEEVVRRRREARRVELVGQKELTSRSTSVARFLQGVYPKLSRREKQAARGLLSFVHDKRSEERGWLRPGNRYGGQFENRWYLGTQLGQTLWLDNKLNVYRTSAREELLEGMIKAVAGALPWVPILEGIAIFATIVVGGVVAAPAGALGAVGRAGLAVGRAGSTIGRVGLVAGRAAIRMVGNELALFGGWLRSLGSRTLAYYLTNVKLGNEIGLFVVGTIVSVEGDARKLRGIFTDPATIVELLLVFYTGGAIGQTPRRVAVRANVLPPAQQTQSGRIRTQVTGAPRTGVSMSGGPTRPPGGTPPTAGERGRGRPSEREMAAQYVREIYSEASQGIQPPARGYHLRRKIQKSAERYRRERASQRVPAARLRLPGTRTATPKTLTRTRPGEPVVERKRGWRGSREPDVTTARQIEHARTAQRAAARSPVTGRERRKSFSVTESEIAPGVRRRTREVSGYTYVPVRPTRGTTPRQVADHVDEMRRRGIDYELTPDRRDQVAGGGFHGQYHASHTEKKTILAHPNEPVGVNRRMCNDCIQFFSVEARFQRKPQVVSDPKCTRVFQPDGSVREYWRDGRVKDLSAGELRMRYPRPSHPPNVVGEAAGSGND